MTLPTVEQIEAELADVTSKLAANEARRDELKQHSRALEERRTRLLVLMDVLQMPKAKQEALVLAAKSILSEEKVGTPGT